jgi:hypothetical protein
MEPPRTGSGNDGQPAATPGSPPLGPRRVAAGAGCRRTRSAGMARADRAALPGARAEVPSLRGLL